MTQGIVRIRRGREKPIRNRHPWIFSGAIAHAENAVDSELVSVVDHKDRFLARGYWNSQSQIQVRILSWEDEPIDADWWRTQLKRALSLRQELGAASAGSACRLVNGESDYLPGLIIDRYAEWYVLQALTRYIDEQKAGIADLLADLTGAENIYERSDVPVRQKEGLSSTVGLLRGGPLPELVEIIEKDVACLVDIGSGHKTGFYLDQRDNRRLLADLINRYLGETCGTAKLLNLFSYTGGFALAARHFGELHSVNVDASRQALELAERNFLRNGFDQARHGDSVEFILADGFEYLRHLVQAKETFDFVVLDPPKFAMTKGQIQRAARGYKDLNLNAFKLIKEGGYLMTFSCSGGVSRDLFQKIVFGALADSGRRAQVIQQLSAAADHPVSLSFPEGEYLKGLLLRVL
ncbi:MAG: class I SAM-dependent rRNA methyltransferase [Chloroflexi bacterium]|nr:class I SAM-dependent rRNA methyltransferase [Chloroflexota bacterium]